MTPVSLRRATADDLMEVAALENVCYADPWPGTAFSLLPDNPKVHFTVARQHVRGPVAGYVVAWFVLDEGELANLAVAPGARRQGLGLALVDSVLEDARSRGTSKVYLEVRESNEAARKLYSNRGFVEVGRRKGYYRSPEEDALLLSRSLEPSPGRIAGTR